MLGTTFVGKSPRSPTEHLYVVITDARSGNGDVAFVNLTKWRKDKDQTCVVEAGEHPFVKERSLVPFVYAAKAAAANIQEALEKGMFTPHTEASTALIAKLQQGCLDSPDCSREVKSLVRRCLGI